MSTVMKFKRQASEGKMAKIQALLAKRQMHVLEIAEAVPISKRHALEYIAELRKRGLVHISKWVREVEQLGRMYPRPVYAAGPGEDAPKPAALSPEERSKRAWKLIKSDPERHMTLVQKRRTRRTLRKPRADVAAAWMQEGTQ